MKKNIVTIVLIGSLLFIGQNMLAQDPPPPPSGGHGQSGNSTNGGGAPIGGGVGILLALGAAYGGKKVYGLFQNQEKLEE
ncbi:MAG: hypothetical protein CVT99_16095 [Bacteroidetes bacterium HGW-Bacteroidetes-16]|jgi:hypothetical protein|nr:MAG: hypothetical protein CVT99_16095 [Bacteroidetes bacterium HGW-Bacteroidetes-16]